MSKGEEPDGTIWLFDTRGLSQYAQLTGNEAAVVANLIATGRIRVYNRIFREFKQAYPDEVKKLSGVDCVKVSAEHRKMAAALADSCSADVNAYEAPDDFCAAGVACTEGISIITTQRRKLEFYDLLGVSASTIDDVLRAAAK